MQISETSLLSEFSFKLGTYMLMHDCFRFYLQNNDFCGPVSNKCFITLSYIYQYVIMKCHRLEDP